MLVTLWDLLFCPIHGILRPETWPLIHTFLAFCWRRR